MWRGLEAAGEDGPGSRAGEEPARVSLEAGPQSAAAGRVESSVALVREGLGARFLVGKVGLRHAEARLAGAAVLDVIEEGFQIERGEVNAGSFGELRRSPCRMAFRGRGTSLLGLSCGEVLRGGGAGDRQCLDGPGHFGLAEGKGLAYLPGSPFRRQRPLPGLPAFCRGPGSPSWF